MDTDTDTDNEIYINACVNLKKKENNGEDVYEENTETSDSEDENEMDEGSF